VRLDLHDVSFGRPGAMITEHEQLTNSYKTRLNIVREWTSLLSHCS